MDYKVTHLGGNTELAADAAASSATIGTAPVHHPEVRAHMCEMPDCSAVSISFRIPLSKILIISTSNAPNQSFSSKAALHGHIRIHCIARSGNNHNNNNNNHHNHHNQNHHQYAGSHHNGSSAAAAATGGGCHSTATFNSGTGAHAHAQSGTASSHGFTVKDDYPCKVCGK